MGIAEDVESPQCTRCLWKDEFSLVCEAYPWGIPDNILRNITLHNKVLPDQADDYIYTEIDDFS